MAGSQDGHVSGLSATVRDNLEKVWPGGGGTICITIDDPLSPVVLPITSSFSGTGCHGADMAKVKIFDLSRMQTCHIPDFFDFLNKKSATESSSIYLYFSDNSLLICSRSYENQKTKGRRVGCRLTG